MFLNMFLSTTHTRTIEYHKNRCNCNSEVHCNTCLIYRHLVVKVISLCVLCGVTGVGVTGVGLHENVLKRIFRNDRMFSSMPIDIYI